MRSVVFGRVVVIVAGLFLLFSGYSYLFDKHHLGRYDLTGIVISTALIFLSAQLFGAELFAGKLVERDEGDPDEGEDGIG